jgi:drug/metabolite transporter (DMT)-like permease
MVYLVIGNSVIAVGLLLAMIRAGEVARVSTLLFLVPPGAALAAWLVLDEAMPLIAWIGMAIAGVLSQILLEFEFGHSLDIIMLQAQQTAETR